MFCVGRRKGRAGCYANCVGRAKRDCADLNFRDGMADEDVPWGGRTVGAILPGAKFPWLVPVRAEVREVGIGEACRE